MYNHHDKILDHDRLKELMAALRKYHDVEGTNDDGTWTAPFSSVQALQKLMIAQKRHFAELGYVAGVTDICLDDDLQRTKSKDSGDIAINRTRNDRKGKMILLHNNCFKFFYLYKRRRYAK